jgi:hypothetical protein
MSVEIVQAIERAKQRVFNEAHQQVNKTGPTVEETLMQGNETLKRSVRDRLRCVVYE